jgi:anti-sigma factor RsiW
MITCDDCQQKIAAVFDNEGSEDDENLISIHIEHCHDCQTFRAEIIEMKKALISAPVPSVSIELPKEFSHESHSGKSNIVRSNTHLPVRFRRLLWAGGLAAAFLFILSWLACVVLSRKVADLRDELMLARHDADIARTDDSATINFYLREHQDVVTRASCLNPSAPQSANMHVNLHDILYYESFDGRPGFVRPGIIVRGHSSQREISASEVPTIANGYIITLSEARETADFGLVSPPWLHPGYRLDQIRKIERRDALHLIYTNGKNALSLFEQALEGQRGLEPQDFREYAVYLNKGQAGGSILAWKDGALSYVLIGNAEMSQLIDMAQSISSKNERKQE